MAVQVQPRPTQTGHTPRFLSEGNSSLGADADKEFLRYIRYHSPNYCKYEGLNDPVEYAGLRMRCKPIEDGRRNKAWQKKYEYANHFTGCPIHVRYTSKLYALRFIQVMAYIDEDSENRSSVQASDALGE